MAEEMKWRPISLEQKPDGRVIIYTKRGNPATYTGIFIAEYAFADGDDDWWQLDEGGYCQNPSHYMPLPEPPA